jgi:hypothetical protein
VFRALLLVLPMPNNRRKKRQRPICSSVSSDLPDGGPPDPDVLAADTDCSCGDRSDDDDISDAAPGGIDGFVDGTADSDDDEEDAADKLIEFCTRLLLERTLTYQIFCLIMFYAGRLNADGITKCSKFGLGPNYPSGRYGRVCHKTLGIWRSRNYMYDITFPGRERKRIGREPITIPVVAAHEVVDKAFRDDATVRAKLQEKIAKKELPECYFTHPVVRDHGTIDNPIFPMACFIDGVPYSLVDGVLGVWLHCMISSRRWLLAVVRKSVCCTCGCRGWCTFYELFSYMHWVFNAMATQIYPSARHDGQPWRATDAVRQALSGGALHVRCCLLYLNCDWMEVSASLGMPSWQDGLRPCYSCNSTKDAMCNVGEVTEHSDGDFRANSEEDYFNACRRCEHVFQITREQHADICRVLRYDKRDDGLRGLALRQDVPSVPGLIAGMRLEPTQTLKDVAAFFDITIFPVAVLFWLVSSETLARHRNPLFDITLGITPFRVLNADLLHCLYLGVFNVFVGAMIWSMIVSGAWSSRMSNFEEQIKIGVIVFKQRIRAWYKARRRAGEKNITMISDLTRKMIGEPDDFKCSFKGAECWYVMRFLLDELQTAGVKPAFVQAGRYLERLIGLWRDADWRLSAQEISESWMCFTGFIACTSHEDKMDIPKKHQFMHVLRRLSLAGNPMWYTCWKWEALNKPLKRSCRNISQQGFELTVLNAMGRLLAEGHI